VFIGFIFVIVMIIDIVVMKKASVDDTLDVFPSHGVGGIVGMLLTSVFAKDVGPIQGE